MELSQMRQPDISKLALVYARQSTPGQVSENIFSTESQLGLQGVAVQHGFPHDQVLLIDDDLGVSGRTIDRRVGLSRTLDLMDQGLVGAVYVEDITRLSRDSDTVDHMVIARQCRRADVPLFMGGSWRDMNDFASRLAFKYEAVGASEQWGQTVDKLRRTKRLAAERGRVVGRLPRGYRKNTDVARKDPTFGLPVIHQGEAAVIRGLLDKLWAAGSVRALYAQTYPTRWPDGEVVSYVVLHRLMKNPVYRGVYRWHDIEVPDNHPAIIPPEEAREIDRLLVLNKSTKRRPATKPQGTLAGLVRCSTHNRKMTQINHRAGRIYACHDRPPGRPNEYHFGVAAYRLEAIVMADFWDRMSNGLIEGIIGNLEDKRTDALARVDAGEVQRQILQKQVDGYSQAVADPMLSQAARGILIAKLNDAVAALDAHQARSEMVRGVDVELSAYRQMRQDADFHMGLRVLWEDEPIAWRRSWLRRFIERVEVTQGVPHREIAVYYLDGQVSRLSDSPRGWSPEELDLVRALMESPERPGRGYRPWLEKQFQAKGYTRRGEAIYKQYLRTNSDKPS
jgi:DNA invertase Pin-like site-specific DNA recombinase